MHSEITQILLRKFSYANTVHLQVQAADERGEDGQDQLQGTTPSAPFRLLRFSVLISLNTPV